MWEGVGAESLADIPGPFPPTYREKTGQAPRRLYISPYLYTGSGKRGACCHQKQTRPGEAHSVCTADKSGTSTLLGRSWDTVGA